MNRTATVPSNGSRQISQVPYTAPYAGTVASQQPAVPRVSSTMSSVFKKKTLMTSAALYTALGAIVAIYIGIIEVLNPGDFFNLIISFMIIGFIIGLSGTAIYNSFYSSTYSSGEYAMSLISPILLFVLLFTGIGLIILLFILAALKN